MSVEDAVDKLIASKKKDNNNVVVKSKHRKFKRGLRVFKKSLILYLFCFFITTVFVTLVLFPLVGRRKDDSSILVPYDDNVELVLSGDDVVVPEPYIWENWTAPPSSFGATSGSIKRVNYTYFWGLFHNNSYFNLEFRSKDTNPWENYTSYLDIGRIDMGDYEKHIINFSVPETGYYRVNYTVDGDIVNYSFDSEHHTLSYNYSIPDGDGEVYWVYYNWSDVVHSSWNDYMIYSHGVNSGGMFLELEITSKLSKNAFISIDPTFGYESGSVGLYLKRTSPVSYHYQYGVYASPDSSGTVDNITINIYTDTGDWQCALYEYVDYSSSYAGDLIATTEVGAGGDGLQTFDFSEPKPSVTVGTNYYLLVRAVGTSSRIYADSSGSIGVRVDPDPGSFADPCTNDASTSYDVYIFATYTESGGGFVDTVPTVEPISPVNNSIGQNQSGYFNCWFNDTDGNVLNITWFYFDGSVYHNFANNNSVTCNQSYDVYLPDHYNDSCSIEKWKVEVDDGYLNITRNFTFSTRCPIWQILDQTVNGSYKTPDLTMTILDSTINGSYVVSPITLKIVDKTINGSYVSALPLRIIDTTINGSYTIGDITLTILDTTINGSYVVSPIELKIIDTTINGSYKQDSQLKIISTDINGSYALSETLTILNTNVNGSYLIGDNVLTILNQDINGSYVHIPTAITWQILDQTINGSYYIGSGVLTILDTTINGSYLIGSISETIIDKTINGSYVQVASGQVVDKDINGSYNLALSLTILDKTVNGSYVTPSLSWQVLDKDVNGSYVVPAITLKIVDKTINGSYKQDSQLKIISTEINGSYTIGGLTESILNQDVNGSYVHIPAAITWKIVDQTINGSYYIGDTTLTILDTTINGSYVVSPIELKILDTTVNGSYVSGLPLKIIDNNINGSYTTSYDFIILDKTINGSYVTASPFIIVDKNINGSYRHIPTGIIILTSEKPVNGSSISIYQPTLYFTLGCPSGVGMSYKIYFGNTSDECSYLAESNSSVVNGTYYYVNYTNATSYGTYYWRVHYNDTVTHLNSTFNFVVGPTGGGGLVQINRNMGFATIMASLNILGVIAYIKRRRRKNEVKEDDV